MRLVPRRQRREAIGWLEVAAGAVLTAGVAGWLNRVYRPANETRLYTQEALGALENAARHLEALRGLERTNELAAALPPRLEAYLDSLGAGGERS